MATKNRKIMMLLDNACCHTIHGLPKTMIGVFEAFVLSKIKIVIFSCKCDLGGATFGSRSNSYSQIVVHMQISGLDFGTICNNK